MKRDVLIFGADGALGKGISEVLIAKNYDTIYLFDFKFDKKNYPGNVKVIEYGDLSNEENIVKAMEAVATGKDKYLFLYSTIGGFFGGPKIWDTESSDWDKMFSMNLKTSFFICKHFARLVKECNGGSIILTSAFAAIDPETGKGAYGASKRGVASLIETLALEGAEINMTANAIAPYIIDTPANRQWSPGADTSGWIKPQEIGELTHSIFSNFNFISGNVLKLKIRLNIQH